MNDEEIKALKQRVKAGDVWWNDGDSHIRQVRTVSLNWVEFEDQPELTEPAALLVRGGAVALYNVDASSFVTLAPALVASEEAESAASDITASAAGALPCQGT